MVISYFTKKECGMNKPITVGFTIFLSKLQSLLEKKGKWVVLCIEKHLDWYSLYLQTFSESRIIIAGMHVICVCNNRALNSDTWHPFHSITAVLHWIVTYIMYSVCIYVYCILYSVLCKATHNSTSEINFSCIGLTVALTS